MASSLPQLATHDLTQVPVDPARFVEAAQAAFGIGTSYNNPHAKVLITLEERLNAPTTTGLRDPFAPAIGVLLKELYGPSRAYWDEATAIFCRTYGQALCSNSKVTPQEVTHEIDAAVLRWRTLLILVDKSPDYLRGLLERISAERHPRTPPFQARHCAVTMVYQAAITALWHDDSQEPESDDYYVFNIKGLDFMMRVMGGRMSKQRIDRNITDTIWHGLFDERLGVSRRAFSSLSQRFLAYLVTLVGSKGAMPVETYRVWANDLADWAQIDPQWVREAFASLDADRSPAHEIDSFGLRLPDCLWSDYADPPPVELRWFSAPPSSGEHDGRWWQEVTICREMLPYLRRLCLYLDQMPLAPAGCEK